MIRLIYCDGACKGNPGPAGCAAVLCDKDNNVLDKISVFLGDNQTNNVAEYYGVIFGIKLAHINKLNNHAALIIFKLDSQLICKQLNGHYKINNKRLKDLNNYVHDLINTYLNRCKVKFEYIPRNLNRIADKLAKDASNRKP